MENAFEDIPCREWQRVMNQVNKTHPKAGHQNPESIGWYLHGSLLLIVGRMYNRHRGSESQWYEGIERSF